eukprot:1080684-Prymnesium_polylepis.1
MGRARAQGRGGRAEHAAGAPADDDVHRPASRAAWQALAAGRVVMAMLSLIFFAVMYIQTRNRVQTQ